MDENNIKFAGKLSDFVRNPSWSAGGHTRPADLPVLENGYKFQLLEKEKYKIRKKTGFLKKFTKNYFSLFLPLRINSNKKIYKWFHCFRYAVFSVVADTNQYNLDPDPVSRL